MNIITAKITSPASLRDPVFRRSFKAEQLFEAPPDGHRFKVGDKCRLTGLEDFAEFNGKRATITGIREDGPNGKAYYIDGPITEYMNWVYEYRLEAAK